MTDDQEAREAARWFASALSDEPAGAVDVDAAIRQGDRRLRQRRMWAVGGVAAAVTVGVVGVGLGTRWIGGSTVTPAAVPGCSTVVSTAAPIGVDGPLLLTSLAPGASSPSEQGPAGASDEYLVRAPAAVIAALPTGVVEYSPSPGPDDHGADGAPGGQFWMSNGEVSTTMLTVQDAGGTRQARLTLDLQGYGDGAPPSCADSVIRRVVSDDGTVVDVSREGAAGLVAHAWFPDGSAVRLTLEPSDASVGLDTSSLPMTDEQLATLAATRALSMTG
ncbi:hypothetical protein FDO65_12850 [Nakamurella flava]|uniref:Uncharacterized protein n=1 Tax=Nakamurella flava TaxID=2576308 RepID=A0A4U6QEH2_9ACTN|nr:hypothetical protein [Nakamurella flava]TKV58448.1 hypothetical protein FDO65_12850 [Nakamurella flava]